MFRHKQTSKLPRRRRNLPPLLVVYLNSEIDKTENLRTAATYRVAGLKLDIAILEYRVVWRLKQANKTRPLKVILAEKAQNESSC